MVFNVTLDFSFIEEYLPLIHYPDTTKFQKITSHEAAKGIYNHAKRFHNTDKDLSGFWTEKLQELKGKKYLKNALLCIEYIKKNISDFNEAFRELETYLPREIDLSSTLFCILGYDIGVVSDGNAFLNLGHPLFHENKRELLYFAMHELHHVAFTHYNPIYSFDDLKTTGDLIRIIRYSTHLEGLAVYSSLDRRRRENGYAHRDYLTLNDSCKMSQLKTQFFDILQQIEAESSRSLVEDDWGVLELMSDGDRLWYVVGSCMAESIERSLGKEALNSSIVGGPETFFKLYQNSIS